MTIHEWFDSLHYANFKQKIYMTNGEFTYNGVKIEVDLDLDIITIQGIKNVPKVAELFKDCHNLKDATRNIAEAIGEYVCPICGRITETENCEFGCSYNAVIADMDE